MKQQFSLQSFSQPSNNLNLTTTISFESNSLSIDYQLFGELNNIQIASPVDNPTRQNELWQDTCLEFFLAIPDSSAYWEFNLSPSGNWNVYSFDDYRQGMQEESAFTSLPFQCKGELDYFSLSLNVNPQVIIANPQTLEIAVTAVIKNYQNEVSYWALKHKGKEADFHRRDSFVNIAFD